jgi:hypothetical protein
VVNASLNWASIVGIVLAVGGAFLYFMRSFKPALARDYDVFFAAVGLLCGGILFFQGWRLDPILQFGQFLLAGTTVFFAYESVRLRGVTTEQARRSAYFDDDEPAPRPRMGGGRDWRDDVDRFDEPQPLRRRIRSREDGYGDTEDDDFYRPRRPAARAAIPERAASRDDWGADRSDERTGERERSSEPGASRYRAGGAAGSTPTDFGARRQGREEQRRGSRPNGAADGVPRSSRRPGSPGSEASPAGVPQGSPYRATPDRRGSDVSDAEFRPIPPAARSSSNRPGDRPADRPSDSPADRPSSRPSGSDQPPRDNSSRFDD